MYGCQQAQVHPTPTHSGRPSLVGRLSELHMPSSPASACCCGSPGLDRHTRPWRKLDCSPSFLPILGVWGGGDAYRVSGNILGAGSDFPCAEEWVLPGPICRKAGLGCISPPKPLFTHL